MTRRRASWSSGSAPAVRERRRFPTRWQSSSSPAQVKPTVVPAAAHSAHHHDDKKENAMSDTTVIDPVCGMTVDPATAAATAEHDGTTYYFCAKGCQKTFLADPAQHV